MRKTIAILFTAACLAPCARAAADVDAHSQADNYADLWLRLDADRVGVAAWVGGTTPVGPLLLASNLVVTQVYSGAVDPMRPVAAVDAYDRAPVARVELGPAFSSGGFFFLPKVGLGYDFDRPGLGPFVPQLMTIVQGGPLYVESWVQFFFYDLFDDGAQDSFYTRDMILVALSNSLALGPQAELTLAIQNGAGKTLRSLPVGAGVNFAPVEAATFGAFVGYETQPIARNAEGDVASVRLTATFLF